MQPKFSIALIARNEAKTLPRLVASLSEFQKRGGQILLLDTGSKDDTAKVARDLGCEVIEVGDRFRLTINADLAHKINAKFLAGSDAPLVNDGDSLFDYSAARNYIATFAKNTMIATPDCDEIYTKFDIEKIEEAIANGAHQLEYNFVYAHDAEGKEMIKFKHSKFYDRSRAKWVGIIHEVLAPIDGQEVKRVFLSEEIIKLEHWQNPETNRGGYLKGLALDCFMNPGNDRNSHYFGRELMYTGRPHSAIKELKRHVAMKRWPTEASQSYIHMGDAYLMLGDRENAIASFANAIDLEPNRREPYMKLAEIYYREGRPDQTIAYVAAALQVKGVDFYANYQPYYEQLPHEMMYWALWQKGEAHASMDHFNVCLGYQPYNPKYLHDFRFYFNLPKISFVIPTLGRQAGLERVINSIKALNYPQDKVEIIVIEDEPRIGVPKRVNEGAAKATGEWIVFAANDLEFTPDSVMIAFRIAMENSKLFMAFNTNMPGETKPRLCEHFMMHKKIVARLDGKVFDEDFNHVGVDDLLWAKMQKMGQAMRAVPAIVHHYHFSRPGGQMDAVYEKGWNEESVSKDRALLETKLKELNETSDERFQG
mgnify:CR=1 FL=1